VNKHVRIRDYVSKPEGVGDQKSLRNTSLEYLNLEIMEVILREYVTTPVALVSVELFTRLKNIKSYRYH